MKSAWTRPDLNRSSRRDSFSGSSLLFKMNKNTKVLALKYRPQTFADLIGQNVVAETILNSIEAKAVRIGYDDSPILIFN